jgi:WD40 repeat protein
MRFLRKQPFPPLSSNLTAALTGHGGAVNAVRFSPGGRLLASAGRDWRVILWDLADPAHPAQRAALTHPRPDPRERPSIWRAGMIGRSPRLDPGVKAVGFSPDGRLLATGAAAKDSAIMWDVTDPEHPARTAAICPQGRDWAAKMAESQRPAVNAVAFSPDGRLLATGLSPDPAGPPAAAGAPGSHRSGWRPAARRHGTEAW